MHPLNQEFGLLKLRRQLEEILAMVKADPNGGALARCEDEIVVSSVDYEGDVTSAETDAVNDMENSESACEDAPCEVVLPHGRDVLYDNALVVVTEFGQASPAILQMWLSIDYSSAITILSRFQSDGLISSKGKVRHKAFALRRSLEQQTQ